MTLLDRHIFRSVLTACAAAMGMFVFILTVGNVMRDLLGPLLAGQIPVSVFIRLVLLLPPYVISYALPLGMLTGVLLTLGRLSSDSEVTAMRTAGMSIPRIARPVYALALLCALLAGWVNFETMPRARVEYHHMLAEATRANPLGLIVPKTFMRDFSGLVIYVGAKEGTVVHDLWMWQLDQERRVVRSGHAESGRVDYDESTNELLITPTNARIEVRNARDPENFAESPMIGTYAHSDPWRFDLGRIFGGRSVQTKLQWMTFSQLGAEKARLAAEPPAPPASPAAHEQARTRMKLLLIIQDKWATAVAVLSFAIVGVPLGIRVSRRETSANLGVAVVLALAYYLLTVAAGSLDRHPEYRPDMLIWIPNLAFIAIGWALLRRVSRG